MPRKPAGCLPSAARARCFTASKIGLEKACPDTKKKGICEQAVLLCSEQAHYATKTVANWLGLGEDNVIQVPTTPDNEIRPCLLESHLRSVLKDGRKDRRDHRHAGHDRRLRPG